MSSIKQSPQKTFRCGHIISLGNLYIEPKSQQRRCKICKGAQLKRWKLRVDYNATQNAYRKTDEYRAIRNAKRRQRFKEDPVFRLNELLRRRLRRYLKGTSRPEGLVDLIGCSINDLLSHIERQFLEGMSWGNWGEWEVDHIKPLASFDLLNEQERFNACHYTNLQPLWKRINRVKGARY